jgi:serine/threonine protein phosphatase PrpC
MKTFSLCATGTIRERNQDSLLIDSSLGLAIIVDGTGPNGAQAAQRVAAQVINFIKENAHVFSAQEAVERLSTTICRTAEAIEQEFPQSIAGTAALWIHREQVALSWAGTCKIAANSKLVPAKSRANARVFELSQPAAANDCYILLSEGLSSVFTNNYLNELAHELLGDFDKDKLQFFWNEAGSFYDGDDRSMALICLQKSDETLGNPKEIELFTDFDRQFSIPLWAPIAAGTGLGAFALYLGKKAYNKLKFAKSINLKPLMRLRRLARKK